MSEHVLRFERFELQLAERQLLRDGEVVPLRARAFDLLVALARRPGQLVTKDELLELVWPGLVVEENNVAAQVAALRKVLASELIVTVPGRGYRFAGRPLAGAAAAPVDPFRTAAPLRPTLFGRDADLVRLRATFQRGGCLSLVGPGGVGKTALALRLHAEWPTDAPDRAAPLWLDLAALSAGEQLLPALCRALGIEAGAGEAPAAVAAALDSAPRLLVLDNAEHLIDAVAALVPQLVAAAPALHVLVTSQLPLAIGGEHVERIDPLALPAADANDEQARQSGAMALFVDRVLGADPRFRFAPESLPLVRQLCAALDGLPLALEMAAARVPLLGLQKVHEGLTERFAMLRQSQRDKPGRHRTLQAALDWSHDLLDAEEQRLFHALGVFAGGFTLDLAVDLASASDDRWDTIDRIAVLVDRSLVQGNHDDPPRYALLETMRSYALQRLAADGAEQPVRARHAATLLTLMQRASDAARDAEGYRLRALAVDEMNNVREAIVWARGADPQRAVDLAVLASGVAVFTPWRRDAADWLASCEPLLPGLPDATQALWWRHFAMQMLFRGSPRAVEAGHEAVTRCRVLGDAEGLLGALAALCRSTLTMVSDVDVRDLTDEITALLDSRPDWSARDRAGALGTLALASEGRGDYALSLSQRLEELAVAQAGGLTGTIDGCEAGIAEMLARLGRTDEALARLHTHLGRIAGRDSFNVAHLQMTIVDVLLRADRAREALAEAAAALATCRRHGMPEMSDFAALIAAQIDHPRAAALLLGHAQRVYAALGGQLLESAESAFTRARACLQPVLTPAELDRLIARGARLDEAAADRLLFAATDPTDAELDALPE